MSDKNFININPKICKNCPNCMAFLQCRYICKAYIGCCKNTLQEDKYLPFISKFFIKDQDVFYSIDDEILKNQKLISFGQNNNYYMTFFKLNNINDKIIEIYNNFYINKDNECPYFAEHQISYWYSHERHNHS